MDDRLSDRKKKVLGALVDSYITDAEPISSSAIKNKYMPDVSSATIRSELATLEELGYLVQPHVSSGRVPSAKAYRFYVDCLLSECGDTDVDGLDETLKRRVMAYLSSCFQGKTVLFITHDASEQAFLSARRFHLSDGVLSELS